jgi:hypothetical protein
MNFCRLYIKEATQVALYNIRKKKEEEEKKKQTNV